jgi:hypothetical protein
VHSLNTVGKNPVEICSEAISFFFNYRGLYTFFLAPIFQWCVLKRHLPLGFSVFKKLIETWWSARYKSWNTLCEAYAKVQKAVLETQEDESQKPKTWHDAQCLRHSLCKTEIATMIFIWNSLSDRLHAINKNFQNVNLDIYLEDKNLWIFVFVLSKHVIDFQLLREQRKNVCR